MLVLTRHTGDAIMIGDEVTITVLGIKGHQVRIGIQAPRDVAVNRKEVHDRIGTGKGYGGILSFGLKANADLIISLPAYNHNCRPEYNLYKMKLLSFLY